MKSFSALLISCCLFPLNAAAETKPQCTSTILANPKIVSMLIDVSATVLRTARRSRARVEQEPEDDRVITGKRGKRIVSVVFQEASLSVDNVFELDETKPAELTEWTDLESDRPRPERFPGVGTEIILRRKDRDLEVKLYRSESPGMDNRVHLSEIKSDKDVSFEYECIFP